MHASHINPSWGLAGNKHVIPGTESFVQPLCSSRLEILITVMQEYIRRFRGPSLLPSPPLLLILKKKHLEAICIHLLNAVWCNVKQKPAPLATAVFILAAIRNLGCAIKSQQIAPRAQ